MRSSDSGNFFLVDKSAIQLLKVKKGDFSEFEAYCSFAMDINCGKDWTISGYSKLWGWSRNKVRNFTKNLLSSSGHCKDTNRTVLGHPIHVIARENSGPVDSKGTGSGQGVDTTIKTKTKTKKKTMSESKEIRSTYTQEFESFWKEYPNKKGKHKAFASWKRFKCGNGLFDEIISSLKKQKNSDDWERDGGKYIPHGSTWVNGKMWEDSYEEEMPSGYVSPEARERIAKEAAERRKRLYGRKK